MRKYFSLLFAGAVMLVMTPLASFAQEEEGPEIARSIVMSKRYMMR